MAHCFSSLTSVHLWKVTYLVVQDNGATEILRMFPGVLASSHLSSCPPAEGGWMWHKLRLQASTQPCLCLCAGVQVVAHVSLLGGFVLTVGGRWPWGLTATSVPGTCPQLVLG